MVDGGQEYVYTQTHKYTNKKVHKYTNQNPQICKNTNTKVNKYKIIQFYEHTITKIYKYTNSDALSGTEFESPKIQIRTNTLREVFINKTTLFGIFSHNGGSPNSQNFCKFANSFLACHLAI